MGNRVRVRQGHVDDTEVVLRLWDQAIEWLVARGQPQQWGTAPASADPGNITRVNNWATDGGLRIAELSGQAVGASVITNTPPGYVSGVELPETYLQFLIGDHRYSGLNVGATLVQTAVADAKAAGSRLLRVDCWADAPTLVAWYERQGFVRSDTFRVNVRGTWNGQVFEMRLS